jgi:hypothetical protein
MQKSMNYCMSVTGGGLYRSGLNPHVLFVCVRDQVAYASLGGGGLGGDEESSKKASSAGFSGDDFHPYVYLPFNAPGHGGK